MDSRLKHAGVTEFWQMFLIWRFMKQFKIGLLGLGQIGSGVYSILTSKSSLLEKRSGLRLSLVKVADKNPARKKMVKAQGVRFTSDAWEIISDSGIDVVVELIGGIHPAKEMVLAALKNGKDVVTANKALLAEEGRDIFMQAKRYGRQVFFEASVGGGIPVIKSVRESLISNRIDSIQAIINGTSNYILTKMSEDRIGFDEALKSAQKKGYAEANPRLDVEGIDAAHKIAILASLIFGGWVRFRDVRASGISKIGCEDIEFAKEFGYTIKLLALTRRVNGELEVRVGPTLLPRTHILSSVQGAFNGILLKGDEVGEALLYGRGAGTRPTASAVVSDLVDLAKIRSGQSSALPLPPIGTLPVKNRSGLLSRYYLRLHVVDRPGVLAKISALFGKNGVSISDVIQRERRIGRAVPLILLTHETAESRLNRAVQAINRLAVAVGKVQVIRIEE